LKCLQWLIKIFWCVFNFFFLSHKSFMGFFLLSNVCLHWFCVKFTKIYKNLFTRRLCKIHEWDSTALQKLERKHVVLFFTQKSQKVKKYKSVFLFGILFITFHMKSSMFVKTRILCELHTNPECDNSHNLCEIHTEIFWVWDVDRTN
jgi:hypothetical protein